MSLQPLFELNPAESIFAPFHDKYVAPQLGLVAEAREAKRFRIEPFWDSTKLVWDFCPAGRPAGFATLAVGAFPTRFDQLVFCLVAPEGAVILMEAETADGWHALGESVTGDAKRMEFTRDLPKIPVSRLRIQVNPGRSGPGQVSLQWWGLADSSLLRQLERAAPQFTGDWEGLLTPEDTWEEPEFARGLLFGPEDLDGLRRKAETPVWKGHFEQLEARARRALDHNPLTDLGDYIPWSDYRYLRARERGRQPWFAVPVLCALTGLVRRDKALLRHALDYLMCFVHTRHWCQSAESRARGSTWDQRCFLEEMGTTTCALLYDLLYFALTERGRILVRYAIWDKGLSVIQRDMVAWEYVYHMNQGPWFCRARILGGLVLEADWPRAKSYTEQALTDMQEGMDHYLLPDGGIDEGVGYLAVTLQAVLPALLAYARVRRRDIRELLPPKLEHCGQYLSVMSAMEPGGVLLDGDNSNDRLTGDSIAILAGLYPRDVYAKIARATLLQLRGDTYYRQYMIDGPFAFIAAPEDLPEPTCIVPVFGHLPHSGHLTSRREVEEGRTVRIHLSGCKAEASHTHLDKGAFSVELDREPVLIDRGMIRYDDIRSLELKRTDLHNVLTPLTEDGVLPGQSNPVEAVIPEGRGDARQLDAWIDLSHVWREVMTSCRRSLRSGDPTELLVVDEGEWKTPMGLIFHLHSRVAWEIDEAGKTARLTLSGWQVELEVPWAESITQETDNIDHRMEPVWHLSCATHQRAPSFRLASRLRFLPLPKGQGSSDVARGGTMDDRSGAAESADL